MAGITHAFIDPVEVQDKFVPIVFAPMYDTITVVDLLIKIVKATIFFRLTGRRPRRLTGLAPGRRGA